ncbi:Carbohydrate-binding-like fold protein, partial [Thalictrum thalictroides]
MLSWAPPERRIGAINPTHRSALVNKSLFPPNCRDAARVLCLGLGGAYLGVVTEALEELIFGENFDISSKDLDSFDSFCPDYHLKPIGSASFSCQKLSQIAVRLYSSEESSEQFPSVLLSLSGEDAYRNNSVTPVGGFFLFDSLFPGSFYLRPLLKEYSFSPAAQAIELYSGEYKEVVFQATRVAY